MYMCVQDWFSSRLKQVVFELSNDDHPTNSAQDSTDGASMSMPSSERSLTITEDLELLEYVQTGSIMHNGYSGHCWIVGNSQVFSWSSRVWPRLLSSCCTWKCAATVSITFGRRFIK